MKNSKNNKYTETTIFITGQAKPSNEDAINAMYKTFSLCLFIETETNEIVDIACTTIMDETEDFIRYLICGSNIITDVDSIIEVLKKRFFGLVQKTLIVALKDAHNRYSMLYPSRK